MKIGFSFGRCIRDIVNGDVSIDDVAFLITATKEPGYLLGLDHDSCKEVAHLLWSSNRVLQPRAQGMHRHAQPENSVWVDMFPTQLSENQSVKTAWDNYRFMLHMTENIDSEALETFR